MIAMTVASAAHTHPGETVCGDTHAVIKRDRTVTVAVVDGAGHGERAASAAHAFCAYLRKHADLTLQELFRGAHRELAGSRGAAASVARIDGLKQTLEYAGVGNVSLHALSREAIRPISMHGIVGVRTRKIMTFRYMVNPGDLFVLFTDGISSRFELAHYKHLEPFALANTLLAHHGKAHDDATCVVMRCVETEQA